MIGLGPVVIGPNVRVTYDGNPANDRSESSIAVNPRDSTHLVGASKKFIDPASYEFTLAAYASFDGGGTWYEAPPLQQGAGWSDMTDPVVAFDGQGNAYLVGLPAVGQGSNGIAIYRSANGLNWSAPQLIYTSSANDKQAVAGDRVASSPHYGNVYVAWDHGIELAFARTIDSGQTWIGLGAQPVGAALLSGSFAPAIAVADDGTVYIVTLWGTDVKLVKSSDGGASFTEPEVIVGGITPLDAGLPAPDGYPELPGGTFRVETIATVCAGLGSVVVAWADYRDGRARIYYRHSPDGGVSWVGPTSGQQMFTAGSQAQPPTHDFHPQLASDPRGLVGCAFYDFGPKPTTSLIDVGISFSEDNGQSFTDPHTVTDRPWDPTVDAPYSLGRSTTTFIGDYFGNAASDLGFVPFWTDTRTGIQEIFTARVALKREGRMWHTLRASDMLWWPEYGLVESQEANDPGPFSDVACGGVGESLHVIGLSQDGQLWHTIRQPRGTWWPEYGLIESQEINDPGPFIAVSCAGAADSLYVVALAHDGQMWYTIRNADGSWQPRFQRIEAQELNDPGPFTDVSCVAPSVELVVVGLSDDGRMWLTTGFPGDVWTPFYDLIEKHELNDPGPFRAIGCAALSDELVIVGLSEDGRIWLTTRYGGEIWSALYDLIEKHELNDPGPFIAVSCTGGVASPFSDDSLQVVGLSQEGRMWRAARYPENLWLPVFDLIEQHELNDPGPFINIGCAGTGAALHVLGLA